MAQIGLADTLKLLAAGYKKKDIEALASVDFASTPNEAPEQAPKQQDIENPAPEHEEEDKTEQDIDYKAILEDKQKELEDKQKELEEMQKKLEKLQKANTQKDSAPAAAEAKQKEAESLTDLVRGFM